MIAEGFIQKIEGLVTMWIDAPQLTIALIYIQVVDKAFPPP
jgi:hypothetical protein